MDEQRLVEAQGGDGADAVGVVVEQSGAEGKHRVVDGVPVTAEFERDLVDRPAPATDLLGHPPPGPIGHDQAGRRDAQGFLGPRAHRTARARTTPPVLAPHQSSQAAEGGHVDQLHQRPVLDHHRPVASRTDRTIGCGLDVDPQRSTGLVDDPEHPHRRQSDQQLAHPRRVQFHRGSPELDDIDTVKFAEPLLHAGDGQTPLISEVPELSTHVVHACSPPPGKPASIPERSR